MEPVILFACFLPIVILFLVLKLAVWVEAVNSETDYVREEPFRKRGPYLADVYADVDEEEEEYGDLTDYR